MTGGGDVITFLGKNKRAIKDFDKAIELDPKDSGCYYWRGRCYYFLDKNKRAIKDFDKAIELNPKDSDYYDWRGDVITFCIILRRH